MKTSVIGRALGRVEGESKVTGSSVYSADIMRPHNSTGRRNGRQCLPNRPGR